MATYELLFCNFHKFNQGLEIKFINPFPKVLIKWHKYRIQLNLYLHNHLLLNIIHVFASIIKEKFFVYLFALSENISKNLDSGKDVLNRSHISYRRVDLDDSFPQYIIDNQEKYAHLIKWLYLKFIMVLV